MASLHPPKDMLANQTTSAARTPEQRLATYRTGHGDFVFGRLCEEPSYGPEGRSAKWYYTEDSLVLDLNGFKR